MLNNLKIALDLVIRNKFTKLIILVIVLVLVSGTVISVYQRGAESLVENYSSTDYYYERMITVGVKEGYTTEERYEELSSLEHVSSVFDSYDVSHVILQSDELKTKNLEGKIYAYISDNDTIPEVTNGTDFPDNDGYYLICPENMYASILLDKDYFSYKVTNKDRIDGKSLIGKTITFTYSAYDSEDNIYDAYINAEIVGTYKVNSSTVSDNVCYASIGLKNKTYEVTYQYEEDDEEDEPAFIVVIDDTDNYDSVIKTLEELGYYYTDYALFNEEFLNQIESSMNYYCLVIIIIGVLLTSVLLFILFTKNLGTYKMLRYLGYAKSDISKTNTSYNLMVIIISFIISIILSFVYQIIARVIVYFRPFIFHKWAIVFDISYVLKIFLVITFTVLIISSISNLFMNRKLEEIKLEKR